MTEDEAKTKWCPAARNLNVRVDTGAAIGAPFNRVTAVVGTMAERVNDLPDACLCIGSRCMAWRKTKPRRSRSKMVMEAHPLVLRALEAGRLIDAIKEHRAASGLPLKEAKDYCEALRTAMVPPDLTPRGYCGLAGAPQ